MHAKHSTIRCGWPPREAATTRHRGPDASAPPPRQDRDLAERHAWLGTPVVGTPETRTAAALPEKRVPPVVDLLTDKEMEVLRHLAALLSTEEIARTMFVSVNTVKTHVRGILRKLAASRRNEAIRRARELGWI